MVQHALIPEYAMPVEDADTALARMDGWHDELSFVFDLPWPDSDAMRQMWEDLQVFAELQGCRVEEYGRYEREIEGTRKAVLFALLDSDAEAEAVKASINKSQIDDES